MSPESADSRVNLNLKKWPKEAIFAKHQFAQLGRWAGAWFDQKIPKVPRNFAKPCFSVKMSNLQSNKRCCYPVFAQFLIVLGRSTINAVSRDWDAGTLELTVGTRGSYQDSTRVNAEGLTRASRLYKNNELNLSKVFWSHSVMGAEKTKSENKSHRLAILRKSQKANQIHLPDSSWFKLIHAHRAGNVFGDFCSRQRVVLHWSWIGWATFRSSTQRQSRLLPNRKVI